MHRRILLALVFLVLVGTDVQAQLRPTPNFSVRTDGSRQLQALLATHESAREPGFSLLVGRPDSILFTYQTGMANLSSSSPVERSTPFYIASIGKTMTTFAILKLREAGALSLTDPLPDYFPDTSPVGEDVTIMHLLTHTSGIPDYYDAFGDIPGLTNERIVEFVSGLDSLEFRPGYDYAYSNTAYVLLAEIIENVSGQTYGQFLEDELFVPLGMSGTTVADSRSSRPDAAAIGYSKSDRGDWVLSDRDDVFITGPGGIYSTVDDLFKWYQAIVTYSVVSRRWTELAFHMPSTLSGNVSYMAMGWFNETFGRRTPEFAGLPVFGSLGSFRGFRTMLSIFPQQDLVFILLENTGTYSVGPLEIARAMLVKP